MLPDKKVVTDPSTSATPTGQSLAQPTTVPPAPGPAPSAATKDGGATWNTERKEAELARMSRLLKIRPLGQTDYALLVELVADPTVGDAAIQAVKEADATMARALDAPPVKMRFVLPDLPAVCYRFEDDRLAIFHRATDKRFAAFDQALYRVERLSGGASAVGSAHQARRLQDRAYGLATQFLGGIRDEKARLAKLGDAAADVSAVEPNPAAMDELAELEAALARALDRAAKVSYLRGMAEGMVGVAVAAAVFAGAVVATQAGPLDAGRFGAIPVAVFAGGIGATLGYLTRITSDQTRLDVHAGNDLLRWFGFFRPFMGAVFGLACFLAIASRVLPIDTPAEGPTLLLFYAFVGVLAGLNERWAKDLLDVSASRVGGTRKTP
jgi:hypothetical protein